MSGTLTTGSAAEAPAVGGSEAVQPSSPLDSSIVVPGAALSTPPAAAAPVLAPAAPVAPSVGPTAFPVPPFPQASEQATTSLPVLSQGLSLPSQVPLSCGQPAQPGAVVSVAPAAGAAPFSLPPAAHVAPMLQHMPPPAAPLQPAATVAPHMVPLGGAPAGDPSVPYYDLLLRRQDQWSNFPAGLRVLVADNDPASLQQVEKMLKKCSYKVTLCSSGKNSLEILRKRREEFDLVLADTNLPDIDGFKLLNVCSTELSLPVVLMAGSDDTQLVMRGVLEGARDILIKPLRVEELRVLWQHLVRSASELTKTDVRLPNYIRDELMEGCRPMGEASTSQLGLQPMERDSDGNSSKKQRMIWSQDMHEQFVNAVEQIGIDKAVPKRILDLMSVEGLTRENVASHLQKYRLYLKRMANNPEHQQAVMGGDTMVGAEAAYRGAASSGKPPRTGQHQAGSSSQVPQAQQPQMTTQQYSAPPGPGQPIPGTMPPPPAMQPAALQTHMQMQPHQQQPPPPQQQPTPMGMIPAGQPHPAHMAPPPGHHHMMQVMGPNGQIMLVPAAPQQMARPGMPAGMTQQVMAPPPPMGMPHGQMVHIQHSQAQGSAPMHPEMVDPRSMQHMPQFVTPEGVPVAMPHMEYSYGHPQQMASWPVQGQPNHQTQ